jgi:hypothetical protein
MPYSSHLLFSSTCSSLGKRDSTSVIDSANNGGDELSKLQRKRRKDIDLIKLEQQESAGTKKPKKDDEDSDGEVSALPCSALLVVIILFMIVDMLSELNFHLFSDCVVVC